MLEKEGQQQGRPDFDPRKTVRINRSGTSYVWVPLACLLGVALIAVGYFWVTQRSEDAATIASLKDSSGKQAAELKKINDAREAAKQAEAAKAAAEAALPKIGDTFAVVIGTLFTTDQRPEAAAKSVSAFEACKHNGQPLAFCFVEVGNKSRSRFATEVIAVPKTTMTETEATNLATCFNNSLPKLESGQPVGAFAQNLSAKRYMGKTCLTQ